MRSRRCAVSRPDVGVVLATFVGVCACGGADGPLEPPYEGAAGPFLVLDLPSVEVEWSTAPLPTGDALVEALRLADGWAVVRFKDGAQARLGEDVRTDGWSRGRPVAWTRRPARHAETIRAGLARLRAGGVIVVRYLPNLGMAQVRMDPELARELERSPLVDWIEPRGYAFLESAVDDLAGGETAGGDLADGNLAAAELAIEEPSADASGEEMGWGLDTVRAPGAWLTSAGGGAKVLLIDDGHIRGREDLPLVPLDHCAGPYGGCSGDGGSHGTTVLGVLAMRRGNGVGGIGVAPDLAGADVYVYGACGPVDPETRACPWDELAAGIDQGITWGVDVINMSLSGPQGSVALAEAVARAEQDAIVVVASAGNNEIGALQFPAGYATVLGVAGLNEQGRPVARPGDAPGCIGYSAAGPQVDLSAPFSTLTTVGHQRYSRRCGTSYSAPYVAGAAAILRSIDPAISATAIREILRRTAVDHGAPGWDSYYGYGILDIEASAAMVLHQRTGRGTNAWTPPRQLPSAPPRPPTGSTATVPRRPHSP